MFWLSGKEGAAAGEGKCPRALGFRSVQMLPAFRVLCAARRAGLSLQLGSSPRGLLPPQRWMGMGWDGDGDQHHQPWAPAHGPKCWGIVWLRSLLASDLAGAVRNTVGLAGLLHRSQQLGTIIWGLILHSPAARADAHAEVEPRLPWGSWSRVLGGKNSNGLSSFRTAQGCGCSPCTPRPPNSSTRGSGRSLLPGGPQPGDSEHLLTFGSANR